LKELGEDIKKNGLLEKIKIIRGPIVVDGRNRLDAMEAVGIKNAVDESDNHGPGIMMKKARGTK
jgi:ParB-like chromosome segregation protein Spo0J